MSGYLDSFGREDVLSGGARMIPVETPAGRYRVWVKRTGNNPDLRVLLLHGGPGATHEYLEACDSYLPAAGIEYYYYDQLGFGFSDQPEEPSLWDLDRFVDEVEQVRQAHHVLRMPVEDWPDPVVRAFAHINPAIYVSMQGPSELGISAEASLAHWDRTAELTSIEVPALVIGARHDTMDPGHMEMMAAAAARALSVLPGRQPPGHVRRPRCVFRRPHRLPAQTRQVAASLRATAARRGR